MRADTHLLNERIVFVNYSGVGILRNNIERDDFEFIWPYEVELYVVLAHRRTLVLLLLNLLGLAPGLDLEESLALLVFDLADLFLDLFVVHFLGLELGDLALEFEMQRHCVQLVLSLDLFKLMMEVVAGLFHDDLFDVVQIALLEQASLLIAVVHDLLHDSVQIGHLGLSILGSVECALHLILVFLLDVLPLE